MKAEALSGKVLGTCTLLELIGRGGMGAVFLAQQSRPRRQVAVKVLLPIMTLQPSQKVAFLERFRRETDAAASLEHPYILPVYEYGEQDGLAYLVMPYISGGTLRDELEHEGKLPLTQAVVYLEQMSSALDFAHQRGVIHRDVKPVNILLTLDKRLLLTDFGLVKIITDDQDGQNPLSEAGMPMGTPEYMAPEQVVGKEIDSRADLYSLAVVLYQMLTGIVPFTSEMPMKVAMQHLQMSPPPLMPLRPDLPPAAEKVILRALAKHPDDRYESTRDFASAFRRALEEAGVVLPEVSGSTAALKALKNGQLVHNRRRSLFDPFWRGHRPTTEGKQVAVSPQLPYQKEVEGTELAAKLSHCAAKLANSASAAGGPRSQRGWRKRAPSDIVAKTSITLPSFTGLLSPIDEPEAPSLSGAPSDTKMSSPDTPLVDESTMNNQPKNEMHQKNDLLHRPLRKDAQADPNVPVRNSLLSASRFRAGTKTNLLSDRSRIETATPSALSQFGPLDAGYATAQPNIAPPASDGKLGKLLSFTQNANDNSATQNSQSSAVPGLSGSAEQIDFSQQDQAVTWSNYQLPTEQASKAEAFKPMGMANQNSFQLDVTGTFNNFNAQMGTTGSSNQYNPPSCATGVLRTVTGALIPVSQGTTGTLMVPAETESSSQTGVMRLTQQVKVVKVPLAGRPGQYVTGLLPVLPTSDEHKNLSAPAKKPLWKNLKILTLVAMVILLIGGSVFFLAARFSGEKVSPPVRSTPNSTVSQSNKTATVMAQASAIAQTNLIVSDPLAANIHGWPSGTEDNGVYTFTKETYHIKATNSSHVAIALLPTVPRTPPEGFVYKIVMTEIDGLDDSTDSNKVNRFGLIFCFSNPDDQHLSYYQFLVDPNKAMPSYVFQKYDKTNEDSPLSELWTDDIGEEYHLDHGVNNSIKITKKGSLFTFNVNGQDVGSKDDDSLSSGQIGMVVNLKGTEVAFSNLLLTQS
jgi:serine/threonine protein kinase